MSVEQQQKETRLKIIYRSLFDLGAYCDRSFKTTIQLTNHVNTHLGVKPFQVNIILIIS